MLRLLLAALLAFPPASFAQTAPSKTRRRPPARPGGKPQAPPKEDIKPPQPDFPTETAQAGGKDDTPFVIRLMIKPVRRGMLIRLPVMDTDPNRGITGGVMPIWVIQEVGGERIQHIHAPSVTYNGNFGVTPTYRYYFYPAADSTVMARASYGRYEREAMIQYDDNSLLASTFDFYARLQYNVDASRRFFGVGPETQKSAESSYKDDFLLSRVAIGHPLWVGAPVRARFWSKLLGQRIRNGPLKGIPGIEQAFPAYVPAKRQQSHEIGLALEYDSRDHDVTTTRGFYANTYVGKTPRAIGSSYDFSRFEIDLRGYHPWENKRMVTALQGRYEQLTGTAPFWLLPSVGGKYSLRAYGEGRYMDRGAAVVNFEQRFKVFEKKMAGVTTEFEVAPFAGCGTVFDSPGGAQARNVRPVFGGAVRAVARPQVVGSVDVGVGREGVAVFMDINYSF